MPLRNAQRLQWQPKGLSDSLDGNNAFPGAMAILSNLIPDTSTDMSWVCRPASIVKSTFPGFSSPGFVSGLLVVGDIAYGLIASTMNAGKDQPFAYNILTNTFLTVSGITAASTPTQPPTTGDWTPPILAVVGSRIIVTHPGFAGGAIKVGWFDISGLVSNTITGTTAIGNPTITVLSSNPITTGGWAPGMTIAAAGIPASTTILSMTNTTVTMSANATANAAGVVLTVTGGTRTAPQWGSGDLNLNPLPSVPVSVAQYNGRAYFACGQDGIVFSDAGLPTNRNAATQALVPNNGIPVTALGQQLLSAPLTGGIVAGLIAFQGIAAMQQIQGDPSSASLTMNLMPVATGTNSPLAIAPCTLGLMFVSPEGMRIISFSGEVSQPIGDAGKGVTVPFVFQQNASRTCAAASADAIRISVKNGNLPNTPVQEYWFDLTRKVWHGPHTFPASLIQAWRSTFLVAPLGVLANLFTSDAVQSLTSTFVENGAQLSWAYKPTLLPDNSDMMMTAILETSIMIAVAANAVTVAAFDDIGNLLDQVTLPGASGASLWGSAIWGVSLWGGFPPIYRQRELDWHVTLVAKQLTVMFTGASAIGFRIGNLSLRYQKLGYQLQVA